VHGVVPSLSMRTVPPAVDVADDGLTALVDVDVLHRDLLLAFAAVATERIEQSRIGARELVGRLGKIRRVAAPLAGSGQPSNGSTTHDQQPAHQPDRTGKEHCYRPEGNDV